MSHLYIKCKVNPEADDFIDRFKKLHPDLGAEITLDKVSEQSLFTYIVLTYDVESPYVIKFSDWAQRRRETAKASKMPMRDNRYHPEAEDIILGHNPQTNRMIARYLFLQNDIDFIKYQSYQALYYTQVKLSLEADYDNPAHYDKLKENIEKLSENIRMLQNAIFHGDETKELKKSLYDFVARISLDIRPEHRADKIEKGEDVVDDNPYINYTPRKLTFADDE